MGQECEELRLVSINCLVPIDRLQVCWCGVSEIAIHSLRSNWPGARREGGSVSPAILDRRSNEAPGQFQRNPKGGMSFVRRRCCSLLTDPLRDMRVARA